jgi:hypothetical protein
MDWVQSKNTHVTAFGTKKSILFYRFFKKRCVKILTNHRCFSKIIIFTNWNNYSFIYEKNNLPSFSSQRCNKKKQPKSLLNNRESTTPTKPNVRPISNA